MRRWLDTLGGVAAVLLIVAVIEGFVLAITYGSWPSSPLGWVLLLTLGPVAWLAFDLAGDLLLTPRVGYRLSRRRFSPLRVLVLLLFLLAAIGLFTGLEALVNRFGAPPR